MDFVGVKYLIQLPKDDSCLPEHQYIQKNFFHDGHFEIQIGHQIIVYTNF